MRQVQQRLVGRRFHTRFTNGTWVVLDRVSYNHRAFRLFKLAEQEAALMNAKGLPW